MLRLVALPAALLAVTISADEGSGGRKRRTPPQEFGRVVLANQARKAKVAPVPFDHWLHFARPAMPIQKDFALAAKLPGMPELPGDRRVPHARLPALPLEAGAVTMARRGGTPPVAVGRRVRGGPPVHLPAVPRPGEPPGGLVG